MRPAISHQATRQSYGHSVRWHRSRQDRCATPAPLCVQRGSRTVASQLAHPQFLSSELLPVHRTNARTRLARQLAAAFAARQIEAGDDVIHVEVVVPVSPTLRGAPSHSRTSVAKCSATHGKTGGQYVVSARTSVPDRRSRHCWAPCGRPAAVDELDRAVDHRPVAQFVVTAGRRDLYAADRALSADGDSRPQRAAEVSPADASQAPAFEQLGAAFRSLSPHHRARRPKTR